MVGGRWSWVVSSSRPVLSSPESRYARDCTGCAHATANASRLTNKRGRVGICADRLRRPRAVDGGHGVPPGVRLRCTRRGAGRALSTRAEGGASIHGCAERYPVDSSAKGRARVQRRRRAPGESMPPGRGRRADGQLIPSPSDRTRIAISASDMVFGALPLAHLGGRSHGIGCRSLRGGRHRVKSRDRSECRRVREFLRGAVQLHILHHAAEREVDGAWMSEELARHGHRISPGTLYPTLHRMEAEGLLASRAEVVDGRRRRRYRATRQGRRVLAQTRRALRELADEVLE
jgi:DNA-binding PadR family transcriptional regulator